MNNRDGEIEKQINNKGLNAPRLTPKHIEQCIKEVEYYVFPKTQLTVCCITLQNGYTVTGESACASPENFDKEIGETIANRNAKDKIWALEGYLLKEKLTKKSRNIRQIGIKKGSLDPENRAKFEAGECFEFNGSSSDIVVI